MKCCIFSCECLTAWFTLIGVIGGIIAFIIAYYQYKLSKQFNKASYFINLRLKFKENESFNIIRKKIDDGDNLNDIHITKIFDYVGFFEDIQIAINSDIINPSMVYYLFGYYIISFKEFNDKHKLINIDAPLWTLYKELAKTMTIKDIENKKNNQSHNLKF